MVGGELSDAQHDFRHQRLARHRIHLFQQDGLEEGELL